MFAGHDPTFRGPAAELQRFHRAFRAHTHTHAHTHAEADTGEGDIRRAYFTAYDEDLC